MATPDIKNPNSVSIEELDSIDPTSRHQGRIFSALTKHFETYDDLLRNMSSFPTSISTPQRDDI